MSENLSFHFEGALADGHEMNFYESARFQYAAARLLVKLAQFRQHGKFVQKITNGTNFEVNLVAQSKGSFNINVKASSQKPSDDYFIKIPISDLVAYVSERIIEKIDGTKLENTTIVQNGKSLSSKLSEEEAMKLLDNLVDDSIKNKAITSDLPINIQELIKRRSAELYREQMLYENQEAISRIDFVRSQKLIAMSAPLISEMATALRKSSDTLEIRSSGGGVARSVLFLDRKMAEDIETAIVDKDITPILGDVTQFNKDNGWGKFKIENGKKIISFSIPSDILPTMKAKLIDSMNKDQVYLQTYYVKNPANEVIRLIIVGILPTPTI